MMHSKRTWCVITVPSSQKLAEMLTQQTWCRCAGFTVAGHDSVVFLNDSTGPDGAQEYALLFRNSRGVIRQFDSITFSWCTTERAKWLIDQFHEVGGNHTHFEGTIRAEQLETPQTHRMRPCSLCA